MLAGMSMASIIDGLHQMRRTSQGRGCIWRVLRRFVEQIATLFIRMKPIGLIPHTNAQSTTFTVYTTARYMLRLALNVRNSVAG